MSTRSPNPRPFPRRLVRALALAAPLLFACPAQASDPWLTLKGGDGPGHGKRIVLVSGDEEYRSEEGLPQLAKILARRHGFDCTVLFAIGEDGTITPTRTDNIPGLDALRSADLMVILARFRDLPDDQMKAIADYVAAGKPIVGLRTATHAFNSKEGRTYGRFSWQSKAWDGGFGRQILGETWIAHHGDHGHESTRGVIAPGAENHPILRGIKSGDVWGPTDVYRVRLPLPGDSTPLVLGQVLTGMKPEDPPVAGPKNDPMMPVAWVKFYAGESGKSGRVFTTTMGASQDLATEGTRRLVVNACFWAVGLEEAIPARTDVTIVGEYHPTPFGFDKHTRGVKPEDLARD
ncbi:ThuA domain-containing protein [Aquisphaera insulae]|uniref:ThuA domain-containing protein n=1 Tax=Aquisphaera insulae TaxID=2712864 RepID=UPI0013ED6AD4|nr:ThuA domain-containing protein [Aquisphaera insulae]